MWYNDKKVYIFSQSARPHRCVKEQSFCQQSDVEAYIISKQSTMNLEGLDDCSERKMAAEVQMCEKPHCTLQQESAEACALVSAAHIATLSNILICLCSSYELLSLNTQLDSHTGCQVCKARLGRY